MDTPRRARPRLGKVSGALLASALLLVSACGPVEDERRLAVGFGDHPVTLDPHLHNNNLTWSVLSSFCDSLVEFSPEMELQGALAERWERTGPTTWRFELRRSVPFHRGGTLSAADVVASFERVRLHPRSPLRYLLAGVSRVVAEDDRVVVVETAHPVPDLLNRLAFVAVIPRRLAAEREVASPEGTGSYRFLGRGAGGSVEGEAFAGWRGRPPISRVAFVFDEGSEAATTRFLAGKLDVLHLLPEELAGQVRRTPGLRVEPQSSLGVQILAVYPRNAPGPASRALADPRVRRAMLLALDRQGWIDRLAGGRTTVASQYVHPVVFGHDTSIAPVPFDPPLARKLLAEAGYGRGFEAVLGHTRIQAAVAQSIAEDLARVGIRVTLLPARAGELTELAVTGRISLQLFQWACGTGDASDFLNRFVPSPGEATERTKLGYWGLSDARLEALVAGAGGEIDPEKRRSLLQQAQREMLRALPMLPLALRYANRGVSSRVDVVDRYDERQVVASFRWRR